MNLLRLLRARSDRRLDESFHVGSAVTGQDALWIGPKTRCQILGSAQPPGPAGLLIHPRRLPNSPPENPANNPLSLAALAAILSAPMVQDALGAPSTKKMLEAFPLPERNALFEAQLEALWTHAASRLSADTSAPQWRPVLASFDRVCAELYHLTLDELMTINA